VLARPVTIDAVDVDEYREAITDLFARMPAATWALILPGGHTAPPFRRSAPNSGTPPVAGRASSTCRAMPAWSRSPIAAARRLVARFRVRV
jgi:hypothetical protein